MSDGAVPDSSATRRYVPLLKLASGGMGTVWIGYARGGLGFRQLVAIKTAHTHLLGDPEFRRILLAEAQLASRIHHVNAVDVRDVELAGESIDLVMDYVEGGSLSQLMSICRRRRPSFPVDVALQIVIHACQGLHAAHETTDDDGKLLGLVHRDVSPQNILVGIDGTSRVTDFGIAKCLHGGVSHTREGELKGKVAYMAPEYVGNNKIDRRADIFALGVILWELVEGRRLFQGKNQVETLQQVLQAQVPALSALPAQLGAAIDAALVPVVARDPGARVERATAFSESLESVAHAAGIALSPRSVARFVQEMMGEELEARRSSVQELLANRPSVAPGAMIAPAPAPVRVAPVAELGSSAGHGGLAATHHGPVRSTAAMVLGWVAALAASCAVAAGALWYVRSRAPSLPKADAAAAASVAPAATDQDAQAQASASATPEASATASSASTASAPSASARSRSMPRGRSSEQTPGPPPNPY